MENVHLKENAYNKLLICWYGSYLLMCLVNWLHAGETEQTDRPQLTAKVMEFTVNTIQHPVLLDGFWGALFISLKGCSAFVVINCSAFFYTEH